MVPCLGQAGKKLLIESFEFCCTISELLFEMSKTDYAYKSCIMSYGVISTTSQLYCFVVSANSLEVRSLSNQMQLLIQDSFLTTLTETPNSGCETSVSIFLAGYSSILTDICRRCRRAYSCRT